MGTSCGRMCRSLNFFNVTQLTTWYIDDRCHESISMKSFLHKLIVQSLFVYTCSAPEPDIEILIITVNKIVKTT
jgi:hypothetical protein